MKVTSKLARDLLGICAAGAIVGGCSGGMQSSLIPSATAPVAARPDRAHASVQRNAGYVYVANRTAGGTSELLVYPAGVQNPAPLRAITKNLADVGGVAVDSSGNVYVANGGAGNVLEFAPGATSLIETYSKDLVHPIDATVANGTLYVADQGNAQNGYAQQVMEYTIGNSTPLIGIGGLGGPAQLNEGIAVNPVVKGGFFASAGSLTTIPPVGGCPGTYTVAKNVLPTLWTVIPLSQNQQAWGLAFDANGNLYVSDICANDITIYSDIGYAWTYSGKVPGTFKSPLFLTIENQFLAVPNTGTVGSNGPGFVTVIDLTKGTSTLTITSGLQHPVGAAVWSAS